MAYGYDYTYDALGRLTDALYSSSAEGTAGRYDERVAYSPNGSITSLLRNGMRNNGTFGAIDGALTYDGNRGITGIEYDYGHHPSKISMSTQRKQIANDYTPDGRKLSSRHLAFIPKGNGSYRLVASTDLYVDGLVVRGGKPLMWLFDGGYVDLDANGTPTSWNYYVAAHLGSTRMVVGSDNTVKETISYYPFGSEMRMEEPAQMNSDFLQPYRFTGKELDRVNGLNMYDFGARWYDVAGVPMWTSIDPLAEKYYHISPYAYCHNNPILYIDPNGTDDYFDEKGDYNRRTENGSNVLVSVNGQYVNISEIDFSNNYSLIGNIGRYYLSKSDKNDFKLAASTTGGNISIVAAFSNDAGTEKYNIYLTDGYANKALCNCYNFECIAFHESTHRYYSSTHGGTIGEAYTIILTANNCAAWSKASDEYILSQASYAERSVYLYAKNNIVPDNIVKNLNKAFMGYASFELNNNSLLKINQGCVVFGKNRQRP